MIHKHPDADLRARSKKTFEIGLIVALTLVIAAFKFFPEVRGAQSVGVVSEDPPIVVLPPNTSQPDKPPPPARPPVIIEAPPDEVIGDIDLSTDLVPDIDVPPPPISGDEEPWFEAVEEPPKPVGGIAALQSKLMYPEMAIRAGIEGTVVVLAYVEKDGTVSRTEVQKGIGLGCDEAAEKAVKNTKFSPGLQRDKPVRVKISVALKFRLRN